MVPEVIEPVYAWFGVVRVDDCMSDECVIVGGFATGGCGGAVLGGEGITDGKSVALFWYRPVELVVDGKRMGPIVDDSRRDVSDVQLK